MRLATRQKDGEGPAERRRLVILDLEAREGASGLEPSTARVVVATETQEGLATESYGTVSRLCALTWGAEDLATALGAPTATVGTTAIHPAQVAAINSALTPTPAEIAEAEDRGPVRR